jgi:hypothetical protein
MTSDAHLTVARNAVLKLLSHDSGGEAVLLLDGDEYLDLGRLELGVKRAPAGETAMGQVLPKRSVPPATWSKILAVVSGLTRPSDPA